jgi:hypothetical protein
MGLVFMREMRNSYIISAGKMQSPFERLEHRWEDNISGIHKETG